MPVAGVIKPEGGLMDSARDDVDELQAAFDYLATERDSQPSTPIDRRIYATRGVQTVHGGSPGLGKR